ncbi:MAG: SIMPL domain-containing protein [Planctomycetota bacterium]|nr:SIMPL domain-containing protein [Planctomycetota bacterium]
MQTNGRGLVWAAAVMALGAAGGLVASTAVASRAFLSKYEMPMRQEQSLQVTGSARKRIRSDLAVWKIGVRGHGATLAEAYAALKKGSDRIDEFLNAHKFQPGEFAAGAISTETHYKYETLGWPPHQERVKTNVIEAYALSRTYTVTTGRVDEIVKPAAAITELIKDGIQVESYPPDFYYTKIAELKVEMLGEASKDARSRADQIVSNAGCAIVEVRKARMGVLQITQPNSTDVSDSGIYDTTTIEKDVTAVVGLTLGLR